MYDAFEPKRSVQGVPAVKAATRRTWIRRLLQQPINVVAEAVQPRALVGHVCLLVMERGVQLELLMMIHQDWRKRGIGTALLEATKEVARRAGYQRLWLSVCTRNTCAIHVYEKCGFTTLNIEDGEVEMVCPL